MRSAAAPRSMAEVGDWLWALVAFTLAAFLAGLAALASIKLAGAVLVVLLFAVPAAVRAARRAPQVQAAVSSTAPTVVARDRAQTWLPLWISVGWLLGTFGAFWTTSLAMRVTSPVVLTVFVGAATGGLALGYALKIKQYPAIIDASGTRWDRLDRGRRLVLAGAIYLAVYGLIQLAEYGATGIGSIISHIQDPGSAYKAKFGVYEVQQATGRVSTPMQIVTLAGGLYGVLGPLLVIYWKKLTLAFRLVGALGLVIYAVYFLFIGTQKGLGDILIMLLTGTLAGSFGTWWERRPTVGRRQKSMTYASLAVGLFLIYMVSAQSQRVETFGTQRVTPANPVVAVVLGEKAATGVAATMFYPSHGYLGLSYNLGTPFQWTLGLGSSPVVASYAAQYLNAAAPPTYPVRTQDRTGWPAGRYWATMYPWLASDLTFPGVIVFMVAFGWFFAKMWVEGAMKRDTLALVIFGQLAIAVAYIPANNQLGTSRPTTIGLITLIAMYCLRSGLNRQAKGLKHGRRQVLQPAAPALPK
jgi:hypothetical protein